MILPHCFKLKNMKKIILAFLVSGLFVSCDKNSMQQTTDSIKNMDSLFTSANDGLKTLDSISKKLNDSNGIATKIIIPEIQKHTKTIDSTFRSGGYQIDSINKEIEKITKNVVIGSDVVKTLDSANQAIKNGESAISVLRKTADKIAKQTKKENTKKSSEYKTISPAPQQDNEDYFPPIIEKNPLVKTAIIEIEVEDLERGKKLLKERIQENRGNLLSENFSKAEGFSREKLRIKVPLKYFDDLVNQTTSHLGTVRIKSTESEGIDYNAEQMCDVEITLVQNEKFADAPIIKDNPTDEPDSFSSKSSGAFMDGFKVLGKIMLAVIPFWPIFLIVGLVWYFIRKNRIKKEQQILEKKVAEEKNTVHQPKIINAETVEAPKPKETDEPDYSKYLPKK